MGYHEVFASLDINELQQWISSQRQEDLHLDFKLLSSGANLTQDDKKNLAKAISGFANSDGGLIVWGVDCRKDANNVDAACNLVPVTNAPAALSRFQSLTGEATSPIVEGVRHRLIPGSAGAGFLATLVPRSDNGPHMAMLGEGRYYKRSGDSFYRMEHFDIADMFGRRTRPDLQLDLQPSTGSVISSTTRSAELKIMVSISNAGRGIARFPMLEIKTSAPFKISRAGLDGNNRTGLPMRVRTGRKHEAFTFAGGANDVIHAGTTLQVTFIELSVSETQPTLEDLVVEYVIASEGVQSVKSEKRVAGDLLRQLALEAMERTFPRTLR